MKLLIISLLSTAILLLASCVRSNPKETIDAKVDKLYAQMSLEEKITQLCGKHLDKFFTQEGDLDTIKCSTELTNGIGHFSQYAVTQRKTPNELRDMVAKMQNWIETHTPNGIPALFHEEVLSGIASYNATIYPQQIGIACSFNPDLAEKKTFQTAAALRKIGGALALSPMVDIVRNPSFNRLEESYGEDAYLSSVMGVAFVRGLQHGNLEEGVAACSKHFLGYGGGAESSKKEIMEEIIMPHETIIRIGNSQVLMTGYHNYKGVKCVANKEIQDTILRQYLQFDGITVSDYGSIDQISDSLPAVQKAAIAINAGNDVDFPDGDHYKYLKEAIHKGLVSMSTLEKAVKRVLKLKYKLGLFDKNKQYSVGDIVFDSPEERETAYQLATQSVVMLKNNGILPLTKSRKIALTGPNANSMWGMLGDYTYQSMRYFWQQEIEDNLHPKIVSLKEGLENKMPQGFSISYHRGCNWTETVETIIEEGGDARASYMKSIQNRMIQSGEECNIQTALKIAAESDVIIAAMGENAILCGENRDRTSLHLPGKQEEFVKQLILTGKPVILIVFGGRAQVISEISDKCAAIIQAWYPGEEGGNALADIIYGNVNPSGKLCISYPAEELHEPICYNYSADHNNRIAYPFGYGLSYTSFSYSNLQLTKEIETNKEITISCTIKNDGQIKGDEIVQLYVSPNDTTSPLKPIQLQGFKRITLDPGESKQVQFILSTQQLAFFNQDHWTTNNGIYFIKIGSSSSDIRLEGTTQLVGMPYHFSHKKNFFSSCTILD